MPYIDLLLLRVLSLTPSRSAIFFHRNCSTRKNRICSFSMTYRGRPGPCPVDAVGLLYAFSLNTPDQLFLYRCSWSIKFLLLRSHSKSKSHSRLMLHLKNCCCFQYLRSAIAWCPQQLSVDAACSVSSKDRLWDLSASSNDVIVERTETTRVHFFR